MDDTSFEFKEEKQSGVWKALADPTRRGILDQLREGPRTTGDLAAAFSSLSRFAVMKHLGVLEDAGLVVAKKEGRQRWNHLNAVPLREVYERWVGKFGDQWASSAIRLKEAAERREQEQQRSKEKLMSTEIAEAARVAVVKTEIEIAASVENVFDAWFTDAADWFYESEDTRVKTPCVMERRVGGRCYFDLGNGDENTLCWVTMIKSNREVRLRGDFTCVEAFIANVTIKFDKSDAGTRVEITHRMAGEFTDDYPAGFEEGWADGLAKLKVWMESE